MSSECGYCWHEPGGSEESSHMCLKPPLHTGEPGDEAHRCCCGAFIYRRERS